MLLSIGRAMRDRGWLLTILLIFSFVVGCSEERVPAGLYDYQVVRLLAAENQKTWLKSQALVTCADSLLLLIDLVEGNPDSLDISEISYSSSCVADTSYLGRCKPSSFTEGDLFTDSLKFSDASIWMIKSISAEILNFQVEGQNSTYLFVQND